MSGGLVSLVGAGPGDPGLLTVRGRDRLAAADAVVYDRLVHPDLLDIPSPAARRIYTGKSRDHHVMGQEAITNLLVLLGAQGLRVVRLKGGDPFVFGRGGEEASALAAAGISFEVVPGISSAVAAPAYAGIPVTDRRHASEVSFVTGHRHPDDRASTVDWAALGASSGTIVVLMGMRHLAAIAAALISGGRAASTPSAVIQWGTHADQQVIVAPLEMVASEASAAGLGAPAIVVVGEVVSLREQLAWFDELVPGLVPAAV